MLGHSVEISDLTGDGVGDLLLSAPGGSAGDAEFWISGREDELIGGELD